MAVISSENLLTNRRLPSTSRESYDSRERVIHSSYNTRNKASTRAPVLASRTQHVTYSVYNATGPTHLHLCASPTLLIGMSTVDQFIARVFIDPQACVLCIIKRDVDLKSSINIPTDTSVTNLQGGVKVIWNLLAQYGQECFDFRGKTLLDNEIIT
jgi:hypothetical protein